MISRILMSAAIGMTGLTGLFPDQPDSHVPLTAPQLQAKGKYKSVSNVCQKKKKSKTTKEMCSRWEQHNA